MLTTMTMEAAKGPEEAQQNSGGGGGLMGRLANRIAKPKGDGIDEGTSVDLKNGVYGVSYAYVDAVARSRVGDRVMTCLVLLPTGCPRGDDRGKMYTTTNLRTLDSWTLPDSQHMCGGA